MSSNDSLIAHIISPVTKARIPHGSSIEENSQGSWSIPADSGEQHLDTETDIHHKQTHATTPHATVRAVEMFL